MIYCTKVHEILQDVKGTFRSLYEMNRGFAIFPIVIKCQHKRWRRFLPICRRFTPQNWLLWQRPSFEVHQIFRYRNLFIDGVNAIIRVAIRAAVVEWEGRQLKKRKSSVKHAPAGGIAMPAERASDVINGNFRLFYCENMFQLHCWKYRASSEGRRLLLSSDARDISMTELLNCTTFVRVDSTHRHTYTERERERELETVHKGMRGLLQ